MQAITNYLRHKLYTHFVSQNDHDLNSFEILDTFLNRYVILAVTLEDYANGDYIPRYQSRQLLARGLLSLTGVRYAISAIINTPYTRALLCDTNYMFGNPRLTSLMMSVAAFCILFIGTNAQWLQNRRQLYICNFVVDLRRHQVSPPLSRRNYRRLFLKLNLYAKYIMRQMFWLSLLAINGVIYWSSVMAYLDPDSGFTLLGKSNGMGGATISLRLYSYRFHTNFVNICHRLLPYLFQ